MRFQLICVRRCWCSVVLLALTAQASFANEPVTPERTWVSISDSIVQSLTSDGKKLDWPGGTAGVTVDPRNGDVYMIVTGQGVWKSVAGGEKFTRCDGGKVGGRCETSYSLNFDPAGKRLACFMLDGKCAWTGDSGATWNAFTDQGRNWDFAAVDWSAPQVMTIFAALHESGGKVMFSDDGGKRWTRLLEDPEFDKSGGLGIFDAKTLVYTQKDKGIQRSTDAGRTWKKVADLQPVGRLVQVVDKTAYWLSPEGLLTSKDQGATWTLQGQPIKATIGPWIDPRDAKHMATAGAEGIWTTTDGGEQWIHIAALPKGFDVPKAGWFSNVAWDAERDLFYASKMGQPTYRLSAAVRQQ